VDGVAHRLLTAAEALGDPRGMLAPRARQKHLASAQGESVFRAQPGFEGFALLFGERTYKDGSFHDAYCNSQPKTYLEDALGANVRVTLEIKADVPSGIPKNVERDVSENCNTLRFREYDFRE
jgi:hypothetical protein